MIYNALINLPLSEVHKVHTLNTPVKVQVLAQKKYSSTSRSIL